MSHTYRGHRVLEHPGQLPGARSTLLRLPDHGIGLMVACNDDLCGVPLRFAITNTIVDSLLGYNDTDWEKHFMSYAWDDIDWVDPPSSPEPPSPEVLGSYHHPAYGTLIFEFPQDRNLLDELRSQRFRLRVDEKTTQVAKFDKAFANMLAFTHFDGQIWNWTRVLIRDTPVGNRGVIYASVCGTARVTKDGIGIFGNFWGAGPDVPVRHAEKFSEKGDAEVWFDSVECMAMDDSPADVRDSVRKETVVMEKITPANSTISVCLLDPIHLLVRLLGWNDSHRRE